MKCRQPILSTALPIFLICCDIVLPFKIARYVIGDDAIIAVRINTNGNGINNNYNVNNRASAGGLLYEK